MKVGRLKRRALTSYFLTSGYRRGLVLLTNKNDRRDTPCGYPGFGHPQGVPLQD
jgi:hypothetical protein